MCIRDSTITPDKNPRWAAVYAPEGSVFQWNEHSTYIQDPPFFLSLIHI